MIAQGTIRRGSRCSTSRAFLRPIRHRPNLHIVIHAHVIKVNIDPVFKRAWSVTVLHQGRTKIIQARYEIILSAGAVASPQILMLSGVGPAEHLTELGIPVLQVSAKHLRGKNDFTLKLFEFKLVYMLKRMRQLD